MIVNVTELWNANKIKISTDFDENGVPSKVIREVTPIVSRVKRQLHITTDWKKFTIQIEGIDSLQGVEVSMMTTTKMMNPFSYGGDSSASLNDLMQVAKCFRAMTRFGNYIPELDYNKDSKIDIADLTTVAANM
ncbi:MAG: hypothetical protein NWE94_02070 [Candidatus Bathyarchaeota archaeon]|nr:hypothetical protein [Candidatus Bathyarchaeota archaeon]